MDNILKIPYYPQKADGYCLPACVQMVLAYLNISRSQDALGRKLGIRLPLGVPTSHITKLASSTLAITYETGTVEKISQWLNQATPVIVFIQAGELPYWSGHHFQHAIVVAGLEAQTIWGLDPGYETIPVAIPLDDFLLAWDEIDHL